MLKLPPLALGLALALGLGLMLALARTLLVMVLVLASVLVLVLVPTLSLLVMALMLAPKRVQAALRCRASLMRTTYPAFACWPAWTACRDSQPHQRASPRPAAPPRQPERLSWWAGPALRPVLVARRAGSPH